jgi:hypothetical protein
MEALGQHRLSRYLLNVETRRSPLRSTLGERTGKHKHSKLNSSLFTKNHSKETYLGRCYKYRQHGARYFNKQRYF